MIITVYAYEEAPSTYSASIFLAGPTSRTQHDPAWRPEALKHLSEIAQYVDIVVFIPELRQPVCHPDYLEQVEWERQFLEMADVILTWVPRDMTTSLKGLTTNIEFGHYVASGKLFYGRPDQADHVRYLDWLYTKTTQRQPLNSLATLVKASYDFIKMQLDKCEHRLRSEGERYVPLMIWSTPQFQSWYQAQRQVGNRLIQAQVLWVFVIHRIKYIFSYALHVTVWIAAEDRMKHNEFIISRPDISVVIPYWKHPTQPLDSEILLIKEFRSPARTPDGFVHELPGGSSFKKTDHLQVACDEFFEETGLEIHPDRLQYFDSKQLAATWSTHFADVYTIALKKHEIKQAKKIAKSGQTFGVQECSEKTYVEVCQLREIGKYVDWSMEGMIYRAIFNPNK